MVVNKSLRFCVQCASRKYYAKFHLFVIYLLSPYTHVYFVYIALDSHPSFRSLKKDKEENQPPPPRPHNQKERKFYIYLYNIFPNTHSKIYLQQRIPSFLLCFGSDFIFSNIFYIEGYDINPHPLRRQINHNNGSHYKLFIVEMLVFENIQRSMYTL